MTFREKLATAAAFLGCEATRDAVRRACRRRADAVCDEIGVDLLPAERLEALANHFSVEFQVADTTKVLDERIERFARRGDTGFALRRSRFDGDLLAAILRRRDPSASDRRFVALVDARGLKRHMAFFSKTHEVAHPALEPQLKFEYRDETKKRDEWERLVDQVGAESVFAGTPWDSAIRQAAVNGLTISALDRVRSELVPEASLTAVALAAANTLGAALWVVWAERGPSQADATPVLRIRSVTPNEVAADEQTFLPPNFRVAPTSPLAIAFSTGDDVADTEDLSGWRDSKGSTLRSQRVWTSASPRNEGVFGIMVSASATPPKTAKRRRRA
jgi:hypothetical protein